MVGARMILCVEVSFAFLVVAHYIFFNEILRHFSLSIGD